MPAWLLLPIAGAVLLLGRFGAGRIPYGEWALGGLALLFLAFAGWRPEASLSGLYLSLLAAGAMFGDERGAWLFGAAIAGAAVAGLSGELAPLTAAAAAALAAWALISRARGVRRARRRDGSGEAEEEGDRDGTA